MAHSRTILSSRVKLMRVVWNGILAPNETRIGNYQMGIRDVPHRELRSENESSLVISLPCPTPRQDTTKNWRLQMTDDPNDKVREGKTSSGEWHQSFEEIPFVGGIVTFWLIRMRFEWNTRDFDQWIYDIEALWMASTNRRSRFELESWRQQHVQATINLNTKID